MIHKIVTLEELQNRCNLKVGDLRKFLNDNPDLTDDAPVVVERVEDVYFEKNGWSVYLKEGYHYHMQRLHNENMKAEAARRLAGEEAQYSMEDPIEFIRNEDDMEFMKEQYIPSWCCGRFSNENVLFIGLHY